MQRKKHFPSSRRNVCCFSMFFGATTRRYSFKPIQWYSLWMHWETSTATHSFSGLRNLCHLDWVVKLYKTQLYTRDKEGTLVLVFSLHGPCFIHPLFWALYRVITHEFPPKTIAKTKMTMPMRDLIRSVRACKTANEERATISKELAYIRTMLKNDEQRYRERNMHKLLYMHMMGYATEFAQMECVRLIASSNFAEKRTGYLVG